MVIITEKTAIIEFFIRIINLDSHEILLQSDKEKRQILSAPYGPLTHLKAVLAPNTKYDISYKNLELCLCYTYEPETVIRDGVVFHEDNIKKQSFHQEICHFTPYKNWMNDPNGLCWYQGHYHMFYQFHPYAPEPGCMYWGHAVSEDLLHWRHLPVALEPQDEIMNGCNFRGGAWSGSALSFSDHVKLFFTRHIGPVSDRKIKKEYQVLVTSRDMIHFSKESIIVSGQPEPGVSSDIRDPKIFRYEESWYMVLGSAYKNNPAVLLYQSQDLIQWKYNGILYLEESADTIAFECPDFFEMNGKFILIVSKMRHVDEMGRKDTVHYYVGNFDGSHFYPEAEKLLDFGGNLYAVQSFSRLNRRLALGWISDFYNEHQVTQNSIYGSMSLPRELRFDKQKLLFAPAKEVYSLLGQVIFKDFTESAKIPLPDSSYYACLEFSAPCDFSIHLNERRDGASFDLISRSEIIEFVTKGVASQSVRFCTTPVKCLKLEIFMDRRTCEVFINNGEYSGTKTFYGDGSCLTFSFSAPASTTTKPCLTIKSMTG